VRCGGTTKYKKEKPTKRLSLKAFKKGGKEFFYLGTELGFRGEKDLTARGGRRKREMSLIKGIVKFFELWEID